MEQAIEILKQGGVVIFPTDTAYGIGCRADNDDSIKRLFSLRRRPETKAMSILIDSLEMAKRYVIDIPEDVEEKLIKKYWPGALTILLKSKNETSKRITGGGDTVGLRIPNHSVTLELIKGVGVGILGPSANFSGKPTPYSLEDLDPELLKIVDFVVPGKCNLKQASTVIDCSMSPWKIVREGAIQLSS